MQLSPCLRACLNALGRVRQAIALPTMFLMGLFVVAGTTKAQSFSQPAPYAVGHNANYAVVGDFNGDSKPDLATANVQNNNMCVLINKGDGTFQNAVFYSTDFSPEDIATGDFNKDGKQDLVTTNLFGGPISAGTVSIFLGKGDGTFQAKVDYGAPTPGGVRVADLDGDGKLDLVAAAYQTNSVGVLLGNGDGSFRTAVSYPAGSQPSDVGVADFNSDGKYDLAVTDYNGGINVLFGNGDGTFQAAISLSTQRAFGVATGDLNGDGKPDFVTSGDAQSLYVILSNGNGTFQPPVTYLSGPGSIRPALGDLNGDGKTDIVVVNVDADSLSVLRGNGNGTFQTAMTSQVRHGSFSGVLGDFNVDGKPDLAIADNVLDVIDVRLNSPSLRSAAINATATVSATNVLVATFIDYDATQTAGLFTVTINWGDSTSPTSGTVSANSSGGFNVNGTHTYAHEGAYNVNVQIADGLGNFANVTSTATVADAPLTGTGKTIGAVRGAAFTLVVASFLDADPTGQVGDFSATINWGDNTAPTSGTVSVNSGGGFNVTGAHTYANTGSFSIGVTINDVGGSTATANSTATVSPPVIQFSQPNYVANEGDGSVVVTVVRTGDSTDPTTVDFATSDGTAKEKNDYTTALGTLSFGPGQSTKTFTVLLTDDAFVDGDRTVVISLSNPVGAVLGVQTSSLLTIHDNDSSPPTKNPLDDAQFFVRQHYHDFLNREADQSGLNFWVGNFTPCGSDAQCIEVTRINVSGAFFLSIEFQQTGYLVERIYKAAYSDADGTSGLGGAHQIKVPIIRLSEFLGDTQKIGQGVIVNQGNWQQQLESNKQAFTAEFVQRSRFTTAFPAGMTPAQFVDKLNTNAGNPLSQSERDQLVNSGMTRAQMLRAVAEDPDLVTAEFNPAFVLMQFFGYMRRNPNDPQDIDYTGYDFWLTKLNQFNGSFQNAEMVKAFISSAEYRQRFGP